MASVLANAFRSHARSALALSRARVAPSATTLFIRPLSMSQVLRYERPPSSPSPILFVGNLPYSAEASEVKEMMSVFGEIKNVRQAVNPDGASKGFAYVEFAELSSATEAIKANQSDPLSILGRNVRLDYADGPPVLAPYHKLYITGTPWDEMAVRAAFKDFEESIVDIHFARDVDGNLSGYAFAEFGNIEQATNALEAMKKREFKHGGQLSLNYARAPKKRHASGGRGYGGDWQGQQKSGDYAPRNGGRHGRNYRDDGGY